MNLPWRIYPKYQRIDSLMSYTTLLTLAAIHTVNQVFAIHTRTITNNVGMFIFRFKYINLISRTNLALNSPVVRLCKQNNANNSNFNSIDIFNDDISDSNGSY